MDLFHPPPGPVDINFWLFRTAIRVTPGFWGLHCAIGIILAVSDNTLIGVFWVGGVFVSILVHEFGHVWTGKYFGADGQIVLTCFGGLAVGTADLHHRRQRVLVLLAGPLAQLVLAGLIILGREWYLSTLTPKELFANETRSMVETGYYMLLVMNIVWPAFNLLVPIVPLDGGRIVQELADGWAGRNNPAPWEQDADWWKRR
jgi:Zn-dependent protease